MLEHYSPYAHAKASQTSGKYFRKTPRQRCTNHNPMGEIGAVEDEDDAEDWDDHDSTGTTPRCLEM